MKRHPTEWEKIFAKHMTDKNYTLVNIQNIQGTQSTQ